MATGSHVQHPQRVCPRCSTLARTLDAHCPFCGTAYRRRNVVAAIAATAFVAVAIALAGVAVMLLAFGDALDRELEDQVQIVQRGLDRDVRRLENRFEQSLDERLGSGGLITPGR